MEDEAKRCSGCKKTLALSFFGTRIVKGVEVVYANCTDCRTKMAAYAKSDKGKAARKRARSSKKGKAREKRYKSSDKGKATKKRAYKRYRSSEKGKARTKRSLGVIKRRRKADPAYCTDRSMLCLAGNLISGRKQTSPTFVQQSSFASAAAFLAHMAANLPDGMTMEDYGAGWHVEHKIPREAYDFSNPEDVKRCWSPENTRGFPPADNSEKSYKIIDALCREVGEENFPLSWGGVIPSEEKKEAFYAKIRAGWVDPASAAGSSAEHALEVSSGEEEEEEESSGEED